jgi:hypothetical protein
MPLDKSGSKASIGKNIAELETNGSRPRSKKQIVAIALSTARKAGAKIPKKKAPAAPTKSFARAAAERYGR